MAKIALQDFINAMDARGIPTNFRGLSAEEVNKLWERLPTGVHSKAFIFTCGVFLSPTRRAGRELKNKIPEEPTEEIISAMIGAGAKPNWARDIYNAIKNEVNK